MADRVQPGLVLSRVMSTKVLKDVETATAPRERIGLLAAWQVCSAFAHGRLWAALSFQERGEVSETDDGDLLLRTTGSTPALAWATLTAVNATSPAVCRSWVLTDHVVFEVECIDRMYLNVYIPGCSKRPG